MAEQVLQQRARPQISASRIILPTEHGSWSFLLEPLVVAGAITLSPAAPWIALMTVSAFFVRQPLKVFYLSRNNEAVATTALRFLMIFLTAAAIGLAGSLWAAGTWVLYPLAVAAPLAMQQVYFDLSRRSRSLTAEISGAVAISSSSAAIVLSAGWGWQAAVALWLVFVCRFVPSILYVRNRLLLEKGKLFERVQPIAAHFAAFGIVTLLAVSGLTSYLTAGMFAFLLARSIHGLSAYRVKMKAMKLGVWEVIYGALTIASMITGHYAGV